MPNDTILVQEPSHAAQLILLFHGVGANSSGMLPLARAVASTFPQAMVVAVNSAFAAPNPGGFQWFSVNGVTEENRQERVDAAMPTFLDCIAQWQKKSGVGAQATALIGFSQGAIMALETTKLDNPPASRVVAIAGRFATLPVSGNYTGSIHFLHGKEDPVIAYQNTVVAAHLLRDMGVDLTAEVVPFLQHEIAPEFIDMICSKLSTHISHTVWKSALASGATLSPD